MRISGEWHVCSDGTTRPVLRCRVAGADGLHHEDRFLLDTGADCTVFSAVFLSRLALPTNAAPFGHSLAGISGRTTHVYLTGTLEVTADDGSPARIQATFAAFTDPQASDMSILGRDVLDNFDVILQRRKGEILLLATNHQYQVV